MRQLVTAKIIHLLLCNGGGNPPEGATEADMDLRSMRFAPLYKHVQTLVNPGQQLSKRFKEPTRITTAYLNRLTDEQLVEVFEATVRRANKQM